MICIHTVAHMHEDHASNETEPLTVASLLIRDGVAMEDVGQTSLASSLPHQTEIGVGGEGSACRQRRKE